MAKGGGGVRSGGAGGAGGASAAGAPAGPRTFREFGTGRQAREMTEREITNRRARLSRLQDDLEYAQRSLGWQAMGGPEGDETRSRVRQLERQIENVQRELDRGYIVVGR